MKINCNIMKIDNQIASCSKAFAIRIIKLYQYLIEKHEYILSKQLLRSGTSIGANVSESVFAQSRQDFISKMSIALKEANESNYWLDLLYETDYIEKSLYDSFVDDLKIIIGTLVNALVTKLKFEQIRTYFVMFFMIAIIVLINNYLLKPHKKDTIK